MSLLLTLLAVAPPQQSGAPAERPNVLLIISDDQGYGDFGFMGSAAIRTPHLDELAEAGLVLERGYVPTALCRPSLATLATGLYPHQHGITGNDPPKGVARERMLVHIDAAETVADLLGAAGYRSLQTGKWWEGSGQRGGFAEAMTHGDPKRGGRHGDVGLEIGRKSLDPALEFIDACQEDGAPFFLWYAPFLPHRPHDPPARLLEGYTEPGVPTEVAKYRAMCTWFDETCGALLAHLDARGIADDTLVVLVVDNGWIQRSDNSGYAPRSKRSPYEGGIRTPIVLRWPGHIDPARSAVPVSSIDIAPTILRACDVDVPKAWPGVDLLMPSGLAQHGPVFGAAFTHDVVDLADPARSVLTRWVVRGNKKLLVHTDLGLEDGAPRTELFDLGTDPLERAPLEAPDEVAELRGLLDGWWRGLPSAQSPRLP